MVGTTLKMLMDENARENVNPIQVKKMTAPSQNEATTKRAALGDLQNRGLNRALNSKPTTKEAAQKELKDVKLTNAVRNAKPRVDTHWKKQPLTNLAPNATNNAAAPAGSLLRANSLRNVGVATRLQVAVAASSKIKVESSSSSSQSGGSNEQVNVAATGGGVTTTTTTTLRREDSNLSLKSLSKLRAALAKPTTTVAATKKELPAAGIIKKEIIKKETGAAPSMTLARLPKPQISSTLATSSSSTTTTLSLSGKRLANIEDIDANDKENLVLVAEYVNDIYDYLYKLEQEQPIYPDHLDDQLEVSHRMRAVLIDWINEVHLQFHMAAETFQLAVAIIDRYLQVVKNTKRSYLQLVGVTALFIATKYEELFPPTITDFVYITDDTYTARQIRMMELQILKAIDCNLSRPLPIHFLRRYSKAAGAEDEHHAMSKYFVELSMVDYELASYRPSEIAAGSLFLSLNLLNGNHHSRVGLNDKHWTSTLVHYSRYTATHLRPISRLIAKLARSAPQAKLRSIYQKYQENKFQKIAQRPELSSPLMDSIVAQKK